MAGAGPPSRGGRAACPASARAVPQMWHTVHPGVQVTTAQPCAAPVPPGRVAPEPLRTGGAARPTQPCLHLVARTGQLLAAAPTAGPGDTGSSPGTQARPRYLVEVVEVGAFVGPVVVALAHAVLREGRQHDDDSTAALPHHL